jgi:hypothetical protein
LSDYFSNTHRDFLWMGKAVEKLFPDFSELAQYLVSERATSQPVGLGPQVFDASGTQTPAPAALADESDLSRALSTSRQDTVIEPTSSPALPPSSAAATSTPKRLPSALDSY